MKKMFTKLFTAGSLIALTLTGFAVKAQTTSLAATETTPVTATAATTTTTTDTKPEAKTAANQPKRKAKQKLLTLTLHGTHKEGYGVMHSVMRTMMHTHLL